jgi:hypothetical protein
MRRQERLHARPHVARAVIRLGTGTKKAVIFIGIDAQIEDALVFFERFPNDFHVRRHDVRIPAAEGEQQRRLDLRRQRDQRRAARTRRLRYLAALK